jgi:hypothetical protein
LYLFYTSGTVLEKLWYYHLWEWIIYREMTVTFEIFFILHLLGLLSHYNLHPYLNMFFSVEYITFLHIFLVAHVNVLSSFLILKHLEMYFFSFI